MFWAIESVGDGRGDGTMCSRRMAGFLLLAVCSPAAAQSINIDLGTSGTEPPDYYRAAGMPGTWNKFEAVSTTTTYDLVGLDGQLTGATVRQYGGTEIVTVPLGGAGQPGGADATLLGDALVTHTTIENCLFFNGLQNGLYEVTSYAWMPTAPATQTQVHIDTNPTTLMVGGAWTGTHEEPVTFVRHYVGVTSGFLGPHSGVPPGGDYGIGAPLNGIQLRFVTEEPPLFTTVNRLTWLVALDASSYDVVRGDLNLLRSTGGDFMQATTGCIANNLAATKLPYPSDPPAEGNSHWFIVRGVTSQGPLTYDEPGTSQVASRDAGINAAAGACN